MLSFKFLISLLAFFGLLTFLGNGFGVAAAYGINKYDDLPLCGSTCIGQALAESTFPGGCPGANMTCHCLPNSSFLYSVERCVYKGAELPSVKGCKDESIELKRDVLNFIRKIWCPAQTAEENPNSASNTVAIGSWDPITFNVTSTSSVVFVNTSTIVNSSTVSSSVSVSASPISTATSTVAESPSVVQSAPAPQTTTPPTSSAPEWEWEDIFLYGGGIIFGVVLLLVG